MTPYALKNYADVSNEVAFLFDYDKLEKFLITSQHRENNLRKSEFASGVEKGDAYLTYELTVMRDLTMQIGCDLPEHITALLFRKAPLEFAFELLYWVFPDARIEVTQGDFAGIHSYRAVVRASNSREDWSVNFSIIFSVSLVRAMVTKMLFMRQTGQLYSILTKHKWKAAPRNTQLSLNMGDVP